MKQFTLLFFCFFCLELVAQPDRWQQHAEYKMNIDFDDTKHQLTGKQSLTYFNNSPDELSQVFYHLYFNAFQPGSVMDVRSRGIVDPDPRVKDRIFKLNENEIGYQKIKSLTCNGVPQKYKIEGTILEVQLTESIKANSKVVFDMEFEAQVPLQVRRCGRNNKEGIDYSMAQWYPKMCEYDYQGWHANPYVGREFHGIWSDFDVTISMNQKYIIGGTGYLQNPTEIGFGYEAEGQKVEKKVTNGKFSWHFLAQTVHDFVWAADPDYVHKIVKTDSDFIINFFYQENEKSKDAWEKLQKIAPEAFKFANANFGQYPYKQYSFIQGGDGGMEYPMATLMLGERGVSSTVGTALHEMMHSWYQGLLGTNESLYSWMDEGFTSYSSDLVSNEIKRLGLLPGSAPKANPFEDTYKGYTNFMKSGKAEPLTTHSDHFQTNTAFSVASYVNGSVFLTELEYIIGKEAFQAGMLDYFDKWHFKHPNPNDFIRIMEKKSGLELDWYKEYAINTTLTSDYAIKSVDKESRRETKILIERIGLSPKPIDVWITFKDGTQEIWNIPLDLMRGEKTAEMKGIDYNIAPKDWQWTNLTYELIIPEKMKKITKVEIDQTHRLADVNLENNVWQKED